MSHFSVLVFTQDNSNADFDTVHGLLEPFSEENTIEYDGEQEVKEYFENKKAELEKAIAMPLISFDEFVAIRAEMGKGNDTEEEKADNVRVYAEIKAKKAQRKDWLESKRKDFADFDAYRKRMYNDNIEKHDGRIVLNCNPNAKWDWYSEDGRWGSILPLKSGEMSVSCLVSKVDRTSSRRTASTKPKTDFRKSSTGRTSSSKSHSTRQNGLPRIRTAHSPSFRVTGGKRGRSVAGSA